MPDLDDTKRFLILGICNFTYSLALNKCLENQLYPNEFFIKNTSFYYPDV